MNLPIQLQAGLYLYLICINMITIAVYGIDKRNAVHGKWRIRVSTLLTLAAVGGSAGALSSPSAAMQTHSLAACKMRWRAALSCRVRKNSIFMKCF